MVVLTLGQGVASWLFGGGFVRPHDLTSARASVVGLISGVPGRGLSLAESRRLPSPAAIYTVGVVFELAWLVVVICVSVKGWRLFGPGSRTGMATHAQAKAVLGAAKLRRRQTSGRPEARPKHADTGWRLGRSIRPGGVELWVPYDRTAGVFGPQGSGKTLDLLTPALLAAPGGALVTLTKVDDLLLSIEARSDGERPVAVLDPFGLAPGLDEFVWDPLAGCADPMLAERRARAFTAGTVGGAGSRGARDDAARFYAEEAAKVLQAYLHAGALRGRTLDDVLDWVADPRQATEPEEILRSHPRAATFWAGLLHGALHGDARTAGNTVATVHQAMGLFFQPQIRRRCTPTPGRAVTDIAELIRGCGTIYLLGREDPYASAAPLMTAVAENVLDVALLLANESPQGRLQPPFLSVLDELPSTAPLPTLRTRMANERALGLSFIYAAQTWRQLVITYGEDEARALFALSNNVIVFGSGKDGQFYREISDLLGSERVARTSYTQGGRSGHGWGRTTSGEDVAVMRPEEIRHLPQRQALVVAENAPPIVASLRRCVDGRPGRVLLAAREAARVKVAAARAGRSSSGRGRTW